ncbi:MAG: DUF6286 domain-containing protein [Streptosporangiaceae bacterium]
MTAKDLLRRTAAGKVPPEQVAKGPARQADVAQRNAAARSFRPRRVLPAVIVATLLAVAGILTATMVISALAGHHQVLFATAAAQAGRQLRWDDPATLAIAAAAAAIGIILIALGLVPGRGTMVAITSPDPQTVTGITRYGLRRYLAAAATEVDGISRARVKIRTRRVRVKASSPLRDARGLSGQVKAAVTSRLEEMAALRPLHASVTVRRKED